MIEDYIEQNYIIYKEFLAALSENPEKLDSKKESIKRISSSEQLRIGDKLLYTQKCRYLSSEFKNIDSKDSRFVGAISLDREIIESYKNLFAVEKVPSTSVAFLINALETIALLSVFPDDTVENDFHKILFDKLAIYSHYLNTGEEGDRLYLDTLYLGSALVASNYSSDCRRGQQIVDGKIRDARRAAEITGIRPVGDVRVVEEEWLRLISPTAGAMQFPNGAANIVLIADTSAHSRGVNATLVHELIHQTQGSYLFDPIKRKCARDSEHLNFILEGVTEALVQEAYRQDDSGFLDSSVFNRPYQRQAEIISFLADCLARRNRTTCLEELQKISSLDPVSREEYLMPLFGSNGLKIGLNSADTGELAKLVLWDEDRRPKSKRMLAFSKEA